MQEKDPPASAPDRQMPKKRRKPPRDPLFLQAQLRSLEAAVKKSEERAGSQQENGLPVQTRRAPSNTFPVNPAMKEESSRVPPAGECTVESCDEANQSGDEGISPEHVTARAERTDEVLPAGPDFDLLRDVMLAIDGETARRRIYREKKAEQEASPAAENSESPQSTMLQGQVKDARRADQLLIRYMREKNLSEKTSVDPREFARWLLAFRAVLAPSSWRRQRNAGRLTIQGLSHDDANDAIALLSEDGRRQAKKARRVHERTVKTEDIDPKRAQVIEYVHFRKMKNSLRRVSRSKMTGLLEDWLAAGICTGLTPTEWSLAQIEIHALAGSSRRIWLHVPDPTQYQFLDTPSYRTLDISDFRDETLEAVKRMVERSRGFALQGKAQQRRAECAQLFYKVSKDLFPTKRFQYSLHTLRDQFIANMKLVMGDEAKVCALAGTLEIDAIPTHFTKRRTAWNPHDVKDRPFPLQRDVERYRRQLEANNERSEIWTTRRNARQARDLDDES